MKSNKIIEKTGLKKGCFLIIKDSELNMKNWTPEYYVKKYPKRVRKLVQLRKSLDTT